jgi:hypothetical protein
MQFLILSQFIPLILNHLFNNDNSLNILFQYDRTDVIYKRCISVIILLMKIHVFRNVAGELGTKYFLCWNVNMDNTTAIFYEYKKAAVLMPADTKNPQLYVWEAS